MVLEKYLKAVDKTDPVKYLGRVKRVQGILVESIGPRAAVGEMCHIIPGKGKPLLAEVVAEQIEHRLLHAHMGLDSGGIKLHLPNWH